MSIWEREGCRFTSVLNYNSRCQAEVRAKLIWHSEKEVKWTWDREHLFILLTKTISKHGPYYLLLTKEAKWAVIWFICMCRILAWFFLFGLQSVSNNFHMRYSWISRKHFIETPQRTVQLWKKMTFFRRQGGALRFHNRLSSLWQFFSSLAV